MSKDSNKVFKENIEHRKPSVNALGARFQDCSQEPDTPSLDKVRNKWAFFDSAPEEILAANYKFSRKISYKSKEAKNIRIQIRAFFKNQLGIILPKNWNDFKASKEELLEFHPDLEELAKATYKIYPPLAVYAKFPDNSLQLVSCRYSRHRLDPVWLFRKSQLIRKTWREYLTKSQVHREYRPCHLTLTVPHVGGKWKGESFYANQLIKAFNTLRKRKAFKDSIKGGEYGIEVSKKGGNGLHIHIHSLCFVDYSKNLKELREALKKAWKRICGVSADKHIFLHLETLYKLSEEKEAFEKVVGVQELEENDDYSYVPVSETKHRRKKIYITKDSSDEDYLKGVMECIKYHFKPSDLYVMDSEGNPKKNNGGYPIVDIELVNDIVSNTKGMRMYAKFGFCYGEKELNYNAKVEAQETDLESIEETEMGDSSRGESSLINPLSREAAQEGEYVLCLAMPEFVRHNSQNCLFDNGKPLFDSSSMFEVSKSLDIKEVMMNLVKYDFQAFDCLNKVLTYDEFERYKANGLKFNTGLSEFELSELYRY